MDKKTPTPPTNLKMKSYLFFFRFSFSFCCRHLCLFCHIVAVSAKNRSSEKTRNCRFFRRGGHNSWTRSRCPATLRSAKSHRKNPNARDERKRKDIFLLLDSLGVRGFFCPLFMSVTDRFYVSLPVLDNANLRGQAAKI